MSTPEEVQEQILASIQSMADAMSNIVPALTSMGTQIQRQADITKTQYDEEVIRLADLKKQADERKTLEGDRLKEEALKNGRIKASSVEEAQRNRELRKQFTNRLGIEEEINPRLKAVLDNRSTIEQKLVDAAKRQYGDDVFISAQRNKLYREQIAQYSAGNLAYGGVVTQFKDLSKDQQKAIVDAAKTQKKLKEEQEKFTQTVQTLANPGETFKGITGKVTSLSSALESGKDGLIKMAGGGVGAQIAFESIAVAGKALVASFMSMSTALYAGQRGAAVGVNAMAAAVGKVTPLMYGLAGALFIMGGPILKILGVAALAATAALDLYTESQKKGAEQNDALFKSYNDLAQAGLATADGLTGLFDMTQKLGLTVKEIEKLGPLLKEHAKDLALMGGTASEGAKAFANVATELKRADIGERLERLGITSDQQREHTLSYMAQQTRMGTLLNKSQADQIAGAKNYMEELDKMAALTGASRKEQEEAREAMLAIDAARAGLDEVAEQAKAGVPGAEKRLQEMQAGIKLASLLQTQGLNVLAKGQAQLSGSEGTPTTAESTAAFQSLSGSHRAIKEGKGDAEIALAAGVSMEQASKLMRTNAKYNGETSAFLGDTYAKGRDFQIKMSKAAELMKKTPGMDIDAALKQTQLAKENTPEPQLAANVSAGRTQQAAAMLQDSAIKHFDQSAIINKAASEMFESAVVSFNNTVGAKLPVGGTPQVGTNPGKKENSTPAATPIASTTPAVSPKPTPAATPIASTTPAVSPVSPKPISTSVLRNIPATPSPATQSTMERRTAEDKVKEARAAREKLEEDKGRGHEETIMARKAEAQAMRDAEKKRAEEESISRRQQQLTSRPQRPAAVGSEKANLAASVAAHESGSKGYNAYNKGTAKGKIVKSDKDIDFSKMSISEFLRRGDLQTGDPDKLFAVGKYQIIPATMRELVKSLKLSPSTLLDETTQEMLFTQGLTNSKRPTVDAYVKGVSDDLNGALMELAKEFASIGVPYPAGKATKRGESYWGGANHASNTPEQVTAALNADRLQQAARSAPVAAGKGETPQAMFGGLFNGPLSGYPVILHGRETVTPMPNPNSLVASNETSNVQKDPLPTTSSAAPTTNADSGALLELFKMLSDKMDTLSDHMASGNDTREELLKYSRV